MRPSRPRLAVVRVAKEDTGADQRSGPIELVPSAKFKAPSRRGVLSNALLLGAGLAACPCCANVALASGGAKFDYGSLSGPQSWGGVCRSGTTQSPIDIPREAVLASARRLSSGAGPGPACRPAQLDVRGYKPTKPRILNTGVGTMQVRARPRSLQGGLARRLYGRVDRASARWRVRPSVGPGVVHEQAHLERAKLTWFAASDCGSRSAWLGLPHEDHPNDSTPNPEVPTPDPAPPAPPLSPGQL